MAWAQERSVSKARRVIASVCIRNVVKRMPVPRLGMHSLASFGGQCVNLSAEQGLAVGMAFAAMIEFEPFRINSSNFGSPSPASHLLLYLTHFVKAPLG